MRLFHNKRSRLALLWLLWAVGRVEASSETEMELFYFNAPGPRAEPIRILLHAAGIEFTDTRVAGKDWPLVKPTTPLGFLPVLKIGDKDYCQSTALLRYAAKKAGYYPTDDLEALLVDEVMDSINELMSKAPRSEDPEEFEVLRKEYENTTMKQYAEYFESKIKANPNSPFLVGSSITMVDLALQEMVHAVQIGMWDHIDELFFDDYPATTELATAVTRHHMVKHYYANKASLTSTGEEL